MSNPVRETLTGFGTLLRGFGMVLRRPKLFFLGAIPPLITSILFLIVLVTFFMNIEALSGWLTPFADGWTQGWRDFTRLVVGLALSAGLLLVMVVGFTGLTLALGFPLYDKIAEAVEEELGQAPPESDEPLLPSVLRSIRQSLAIIAVTALGTIPLFAAGFIPVIGQTVIPVVAALFGGWMLCIELIGAASERRGMYTLKERRRAMGTRKLQVLGFAVPTYLLLAVPFLAVVVFPAATAGGTILMRNLVPASTPPLPGSGPGHPLPPGAHPGIGAPRPGGHPGPGGPPPRRQPAPPPGPPHHRGGPPAAGPTS